MRPSDSRKNWLGKLAQRYHEALTEEVRSYLNDRGLEDEVINGALLGLVVDPDPAHSFYEGRLAIPYLTPTGVVFMRFRCLEKHDCRAQEPQCAKYISPKGDDTRLFNVSALHNAGAVVAICEGELDALAATRAGLPSVGVPGASNWKPYYYRLFDDFDRVIILGDGDKAGREFASKLSQNIAASVPRPMPRDHDVSSFVVEKGAEEFLRFATE